jgi:hypothetical protein
LNFWPLVVFCLPLSVGFFIASTQFVWLSRLFVFGIAILC